LQNEPPGAAVLAILKIVGRVEKDEIAFSLATVNGVATAMIISIYDIVARTAVWPVGSVTREVYSRVVGIPLAYREIPNPSTGFQCFLYCHRAVVGS
jgi:hypothetical protein